MAGLLVTALMISNALAQPVFEGVETGITSGNSTGLTVTVPAGVATGDLLIAVWGIAQNPLSSTPAGFTAIPGFGGFNGATCPLPDIKCQLAVSYKIATGTEATVTFSYSGTPGGPRASAAAVLRYSNVSGVDPIGPVAKASSTGSPVTAPSVNTTEANSLVLRIGLAGDQGNALPPSALTAGPATHRFNLEAGGNSDASVSIAGSDAPQAVAGGTGTATWSSSLEEWVAGTITIHQAGVVQNADLSISKSDGETKVNPGDTITYTIVAANSAPSDDVFGALVDDSFPADLSCSWTCVGTGGATCTAGPVAGDIADVVNLPAGSAATYSAVCAVSTTPSATQLMNTATVTPPMGVVDDNNANNDASDTTAVNQPPVAQCIDVTVDADAMCQANASVDNVSFDPDGDLPVTIVEDPTGPYALGDTVVELTITDDLGLSDSCTATVTVQDVTSPIVSCNSPATIVPPDAPISFTATAEDNCSAEPLVISSFRCFKITKKGKIIDKGGSCVVSIAGDTLTIDDSGGVNNTIEWQISATDGGGNVDDATCSVLVVNPGHN